MKFWKRISFFVLAIFVLWGCSNSDSASDLGVKPEEENHNVDVEFKSDSLDGMIRVLANGTSTFVGTNDLSSRENERPQMKVNFTYDFSIAEHELTCGEFNDLMEHKRVCENDSLPIANVTYYDAILYANERSKKENYDTAYTYRTKTFDEEGRCVAMEGFQFHPEVEAYRLPTEAEWILVASQGWNPLEGWSSEKSNYKPSKICQQPRNAAGICDMAGNMMEWVNDWLVNFLDTTLTNFVGPSDGNGIDARIVKGGNFRCGAAATNLFSRGDVYLVTSSKWADYIGFRLAFGKIENPLWLNATGKPSESRVVPLAGSSSLRNLTNAYKMRLVFRNDVTGNLAFIDYMSSSLSVTEIVDTLDAYHPDISPDGKLVAFCTGIEGVDSRSSVYVRELNADGLNLVKLNVESATIPRWRVLENGDTVIVYVTSAANNSVETSFLKQSTWQVPFMGGEFGTPEKLFDGAYHGGVSGDNRLAVSGSRLLRAKIADSGKNLMSKAIDTVWYAEEQACNVSLSRGNGKQTLFLDFGGETGKKFVGNDYDTHERILVADSTGKLISSVAAPAGYTFDHSEWVLNGAGSAENVAVATLANVNGSHTKIVAVNLQDSSILELAEGEELWHPCLWGKKLPVYEDGIVLDPDSAGMYFSAKSDFSAYELRQKMESFWTNRDAFSVVVFGSSRAMMSVDPREVKDGSLLNFAYSGGALYGTRHLFKNYVLNHLHNVKYIVVEITPNVFWQEEYFDRKMFYGMNVGFEYDENHGFWKDYVPQGLIEAVKEAPVFENREELLYRDEFTLSSVGWGTASIVTDSSSTPFEMEVVERNLGILYEIVQLAKKAGIKIVGLNYPVHPDFAKMGMTGPYGPSISTAKIIFEQIEKFGIVIMDENKDGTHDYTQEMAHDPDHLSYLGAVRLTERLIDFIKKME